MLDINKRANTNINFEEEPVVDSDLFETKTETTVLQSGRRHAIKINDIVLERNQYAGQSVIRSGQLLNQASKAVALFANEYIPSHFPENDYIKYYLIINGEEVEVVPINLHRDGVKIVKTSDYFSSSESTKYIKEKITSLYLKIIIKTPNSNETPFLSNLKILTGGDTNV